MSNDPHEPTSTRRTRRAQRGFTLIEMMLGVGVFMVGVAGIVTMQLSARKGRVAANDVSIASNLASSTLDLLETQAFDGLSSTITTYDRQGSDGGTAFFTVTTTITDDPAATGELKNVVAVVTWTTEGTPHTVTLQSKIAR